MHTTTIDHVSPRFNLPAFRIPLPAELEHLSDALSLPAVRPRFLSVTSRQVNQVPARMSLPVALRTKGRLGPLPTMRQSALTVAGQRIPILEAFDSLVTVKQLREMAHVSRFARLMRVAPDGSAGMLTDTDLVDLTQECEVRVVRLNTAS